MEIQPRYVAYYRLSKEKKGKDGIVIRDPLGIGSQEFTVNNFVTAQRGIILARYQEIETAKYKNAKKRHQLEAAIKFTVENDATLLVAKLDRLTRNAGFLFALRDSGVNFICCDMPDANTLTIGIMASYAQFERERISERTKQGLAELKRRGWVRTNQSKWSDEARVLANLAIKERVSTNPNLTRAKNYIDCLRINGLTLSEICFRLNSEGFRTAKGKMWRVGQVHRILKSSFTAVNN